MPFWAVALIVVVLMVGYYLLTQQARERRRDKIGTDFAKLPGFYANQTYTDSRGEAAIGIDDRGRRIAVARKNGQPRTLMYSFAHILKGEVLQNGEVIATVAPAAESGAAVPGAGMQVSEGAVDRDPAGLFGSTRPSVRDIFAGTPVVKPVLGQLTTAAVRLSFRNGDATEEVVIRLYDGKPVNVDGVEGERAFAEAQVILSSLDIAIRRAGAPHRVATKTPVV